MIFGSTECNSACPAGQYAENIDPTHLHKCRMCTSPCDTCVDITGNCVTCLSGYSLHTISSSDHVCLSQCPNGYYSDGNHCVTCPTGCSTCTGATTDITSGNPNMCSACATPYYLIQGSTTCSQTCPNGQYPQDVSGVGTC